MSHDDDIPGFALLRPDVRRFRPVTQTRTGRPMGNCTEASVASFLDVPLEDVPQLWDPDDTTDPDQRPRHRWDAFIGYIREKHGRIWVQMKFDPPRPVGFEPRSYEEQRMCDGYTLLMGANPDGVPHAVLGFNGRIVWDPNPSRRGIVSVDEIVYLCPIGLLKYMYDVDPNDVAPGCGVAVWSAE